MATRNRARRLPRAVASILEQSLPDLELIVVDDASTDDTSEVLRDLAARDDRIKCQRNASNLGPGATRNQGIRTSAGRYVAIMDDDDLAVPQRLEVERERLEGASDADAAFSTIAWLDRSGAVTGVFPGLLARGAFPAAPHDAFRLLYLESNKIATQTLFARRDVFDRFPYPAAPWIGEDWLLVMRMTAGGVCLAPIAEPLVRVDRTEERDGLMANKRRVFASQREVLRDIRRWLRQRGDHRFDGLHRRAFANQLVREARHWGGLRGLSLVARALLLAPRNPFARSTLGWLGQKALRRARS